MCSLKSVKSWLSSRITFSKYLCYIRLNRHHGLNLQASQNMLFEFSEFKWKKEDLKSLVAIIMLLDQYDWLCSFWFIKASNVELHKDRNNCSTTQHKCPSFTVNQFSCIVEYLRKETRFFYPSLDPIYHQCKSKPQISSNNGLNQIS